jgi:hypothetical protein
MSRLFTLCPCGAERKMAADDMRVVRILVMGSIVGVAALVIKIRRLWRGMRVVLWRLDGLMHGDFQVCDEKYRQWTC